MSNDGSGGDSASQSLRFLPSPLNPPLLTKLKARQMKITKMKPKLRERRIKWKTIKQKKTFSGSPSRQYMVVVVTVLSNCSPRHCSDPVQTQAGQTICRRERLRLQGQSTGHVIWALLDQNSRTPVVRTSLQHVSNIFPVYLPFCRLVTDFTAAVHAHETFRIVEVRDPHSGKQCRL